MHSRRLLVVVFFVLASIPFQAQQPTNVQILTGMSRPEVQRVMNEMRAGLGVHCHYCHAVGADAASDAKPQKARAREMMRMVIDLNARHFGGQPVVTCFTCHNGKPHPAVVPSLPQPIPPEPADVKAFPTTASVIQKYIAAVGKEFDPAAPRRWKGTIKSPSGSTQTVTITTSADKQRVDLQLPDGASATQTFDANGGWLRNKEGTRDLKPDELISVRMNRRPYTPFHTSAVGDNAGVIDSETIGEHKAWVVVTPKARFWFDADTGLLLRRIVYIDSSMGRMPEQTDFDDYRDVGGAKLPFMTRVAIVDPWFGGTRQAESIEVGVPVAAKDFEKPQS